MQDYLGKLKVGARKFVSVMNVWKSAIWNFATVSNKRKMVASINGCRRSSRNVPESQLGAVEVDVQEGLIVDENISNMSS